MSDASSYASSDDLRRDAGDPNRDRADLADQAPAQADADAIAAHTDDASGDDTDHDAPTAAQ